MKVGEISQEELEVILSLGEINEDTIDIGFLKQWGEIINFQSLCELIRKWNGQRIEKKQGYKMREKVHLKPILKKEKELRIMNKFSNKIKNLPQFIPSQNVLANFQSTLQKSFNETNISRLPPFFVIYDCPGNGKTRTVDTICSLVSNNQMKDFFSSHKIEMSESVEKALPGSFALNITYNDVMSFDAKEEDFRLEDDFKIRLLYSFFFNLENTNVFNFISFKNFFLPLVKKITTEEVMSELFQMVKVKTNKKTNITPFFVITIDEIKNLGYDQLNLVALLKGMNNFKDFNLIPIITALNPTLFLTILDVENTLSLRGFFLSFLERFNETQLIEISLKFPLQIRELVLKILKMTGGHPRSVEMIDKKIIEYNFDSEDSLIPHFTEVIRTQFSFGKSVKKEGFWEWVCIPLLGVKEKYKKKFADIELFDFLIEGVLFERKKEDIDIKHLFKKYLYTPPLRTSISILYNFSNMNNEQHVCQLLRNTLANTFYKNEGDKWETFNVNFFALLCQCRASLVDIKYLNNLLSNSPNKNKFISHNKINQNSLLFDINNISSNNNNNNDDYLIDNINDEIEVDLSILNKDLEKKMYESIWKNKKLDWMNAEKEKEMIQKLSFFKEESLKKLENFPKYDPQSDTLDEYSQKLSKLFRELGLKAGNFWNLKKENEILEYVMKIARQKIEKSWKTQRKDEFEELMKKTTYEEIIKELSRENEMPSDFTTKILSKTCSVSLKRLFNYSLKESTDFEGSLEEINISLVETKDGKLVPLQFFVDEDNFSNESRFLCEKFDSEGFLFNTIYKPSKKNETSIDSLVGLKTIEGKNIFIFFQYKSRENKTKELNRMPDQELFNHLGNINLEKYSKSIGYTLDHTNTIYCMITQHNPPLLEFKFDNFKVNGKICPKCGEEGQFKEDGAYICQKKWMNPRGKSILRDAKKMP
eukprot:TRINITY_DN2045_c0_g1_i5.p1 TRINITY_DN2045_c0_g1~~TRINITY_DN2045_c0_g1_i5.p1  ORF type:complete len:1037 (-),score=276.52 TRINITY_DN2045_c0_g1_i5:101-2899(-)